MSRLDDILAVRLTLSALFLTFLIFASLLASIVSPPHDSQTLPHHDDGPVAIDALSQTSRKAFSSSWAHYAPYYPAATFGRSTRRGCIVSQVNIVSNQPQLRQQLWLMLASASTSRCPIPYIASYNYDHHCSCEASSCHELQRC